MTAKRKLNIGIIGLGVGEHHIEGYANHDACGHIMLCDFSDRKLNRIKEKYPQYKVTTDSRDVIESPDIDIVSIASYDCYHAEQIIRSIGLGKHVFVEKPFCMTEEEAFSIRAAMRERHDVVLSSNHILRRTPRFRDLREDLHHNEYGKVFAIEGDYNYGRLHKLTHGWRGDLDYYSVVYGGAVHMVDLILWLTDAMCLEVFSYGNRIASKGSKFRYNDYVQAILKFDDGMIGKVSANMGCVYPHYHELKVYGTKATFVNGKEYASLYRSDGGHILRERVESPYPGYKKGDLIASFIDAIVFGAKPEVTVEDIFKTMSVCFAIEKSVTSGRPVSVNYI